MLKKKIKMTKSNVKMAAITVTAITTMFLTVSLPVFATDVQQNLIGRWHTGYFLSEKYAFDITLLEKEYVSISTLEARSREIVSSGILKNGITEYFGEFYGNIGIANVKTTLNVRDNPVSGKIIGKLLPDGVCNIEETTDEGWYKITSGDVTGYVSSKYVITGEPALAKAKDLISISVVVNVNGLNLRKEADITSKVLKVLPLNTVAAADIEDNGEWIKVSYNGIEGYVYGEYVILKYNLPVALAIEEYNASKSTAKSTNTVAKVSDIRTRLVEYAKQFVGYPYVYGGNSLTNGTDCSGFVKLVMAEFGITTPRTASTQYNAGKKISVAELLPGDLIVYGDKVIEHIGIYIGNGQIVHASNKKSGIKYSSYNYRNIYGCVRFIED